MSIPAAIALGAVLGFGLYALLTFLWEALSARVRRHVLRGNYFDARQPFRIASRGPAPHQERPETLIARDARRMMENRPMPARKAAQDRP
jgi:hypothetical protein